MTGGPNDLAEERPDLSPVEGSESAGRRSRSSQRADLERTLKEGADAFRFRTLIEGVRAEPEASRSGATEPPAQDAAPRPLLEAPTIARRGRHRILWVAGASLVAALLGLQVAVLYLLLARSPTAASSVAAKRSSAAPPVPPLVDARLTPTQSAPAASTRAAQTRASRRQAGRPGRQARPKRAPLTAEDGFDAGFVRGGISAALSGFAPWHRLRSVGTSAGPASNGSHADVRRLGAKAKAARTRHRSR